MSFNEELNAALAAEKESQIDPAITQAWKAARLGKFTSSKINKLMIKGKSDFFGEGAKTYIYEKVGEALTLESKEVTGKAIEWGNEHEEDAVRMFEKVYEKTVIYFGKGNPVFYEHGKHAGGSPDGWIEAERAVIETKCPFDSSHHAEAVHLITVNKFDLKKFDPEYYGQIQFNIEVTKADYGYFVSYDPRCVDYRYSIVAVKIEKDQKYIDELLPRIDKAVEVKTEYLTALGYYSEEVAA